MAKRDQTKQEKNISLPVEVRVTIAFLVPAAIFVLIGLLTGSLDTALSTNRQSLLAPMLGGLGIASWFLGLRWYGLAEMGLRGRRPLFAGIGFAALAWIGFLVLRFVFIDILGFGPAGSGQAFIYLLLFEAFAVQLWVFGLLFRTLAGWRGPLTAAVGSGIIFGAMATLVFQESFIITVSSLLYFLVWGILYGIIRLRTGSILGILLVQALQSFTAWVVMVPQLPPIVTQFQSLYLFATVFYLVIIWRLWPKEEGDYRV